MSKKRTTQKDNEEFYKLLIAKTLVLGVDTAAFTPDGVNLNDTTGSWEEYNSTIGVYPVILVEVYMSKVDVWFLKNYDDAITNGEPEYTHEL